VKGDARARGIGRSTRRDDQQSGHGAHYQPL
jgi:hypothetical protein